MIARMVIHRMSDIIRFEHEMEMARKRAAFFTGSIFSEEPETEKRGVMRFELMD
jgi:hypothetical protein